MRNFIAFIGRFRVLLYFALLDQLIGREPRYLVYLPLQQACCTACASALDGVAARYDFVRLPLLLGQALAWYSGSVRSFRVGFLGVRMLLLEEVLQISGAVLPLLAFDDKVLAWLLAVIQVLA